VFNQSPECVVVKLSQPVLADQMGINNRVATGRNRGGMAIPCSSFMHTSLSSIGIRCERKDHTSNILVKLAVCALYLCAIKEGF
jgi:hypothetical protein